MPAKPTAPSAEDTASIAGNAPREIKAHLAAILRISTDGGRGFADAVGARVRIAEASLGTMREEPAKREARVVCELVVEEDMLNRGGNIHGGCSAYLIDICSSLPLCALGRANGGPGHGGVSQAINAVYHSPAQLGDPLRIVSTTIALGARVMSARCEIWNVKHHRLVASGVHIKMDPSAAKL